MQIYTKDGQYFIGEQQSQDSSVFHGRPPGPVYYLYSDENSKQYMHYIQDREFIDKGQETLDGFFNLDLDNPEPIDIIGVNTFHGPFKALEPTKKKYRVNVLGLGDVGGIMLIGMRLLGSDIISEIGIYDLDEKKVKRYEFELNQINRSGDKSYPKVKGIDSKDLFDCDAFVFTASVGIPEVGSKIKDVRMHQLESNAKIIKSYVERSVASNFKGLFMVVSDPVDLLCDRVLKYSQGGLRPQQIKGFGLGVMAARASYYAKEMNLDSFDEKGGIYGPHGKDLIVANDLLDYDHDLSLELTKKTVEANLEVRALGYKPFIAPALSSAAISIIDCLKGMPHYSTVYMEDVFYGCLNQQIYHQIFKHDKKPLSEKLLCRLNNTYKELKSFGL